MNAAAAKTKTANIESPFEAAYALVCGCESNALSNCRTPSDCQKPRGKAPYDRKSFPFGHKTDTKQMLPSVAKKTKLRTMVYARKSLSFAHKTRIKPAAGHGGLWRILSSECPSIMALLSALRDLCGKKICGRLWQIVADYGGFCRANAPL